MNPTGFWMPATNHFGKDPEKECECFFHRRIRELEAENIRFREALELIRLDVNDIDKMRTRAEKAEAELEETAAWGGRMLDEATQYHNRAEKAEAELAEMKQRSDAHLDRWKAAKAEVERLKTRVKAYEELILEGHYSEGGGRESGGDAKPSGGTGAEEALARSVPEGQDPAANPAASGARDAPVPPDTELDGECDG